MRLLLMISTESRQLEIKPNFYKACGTQVFPTCGVQTDFFPELRTRTGYKLLARLLGSGRALTYTGAWWAFRNRNEYEVVMGWHGSGLTFAFLKGLFRIKRPAIVLVLYRLYDPVSPPWSLLLKRFLFRFISKGADLLFAVDGVQAQSFAAQLGRSTMNTRSFRYGIDIDWFDKLRAEIQSPTVEYDIFCPGSANRDDATFFKAIEDLPITVVRYQLESRPDGIDRRGKATVISKFAKPYREYVQDCLASRIVVIPVESSDKPVGLTALLECLALAKPVIITRGCSSRDYVREGLTAFEYSRGDADELREKILRLLDDPEAAARTAKQGRAMLEQSYRLKTCGAELAGILRSCFGSGHSDSRRG